MAIIIWCAFAIFCCFINALSAYTDPHDAAALQELLIEWKNSLAANWSDHDPCLSHWQGVSCLNGSVIGLDLNRKNLHGNLPAAIGRLSKLKTLSLQQNLLRGAMPPEIGNLTSLTILKLTGNGFFGRIPTEINRLGKLQVLTLDQNNLVGSIPDISNLTMLTDMDFQGNQLSGPIPAAIGTFKLLRTLKLSDNMFSDAVPGSITNLSSLSTLYLDHNVLTGSFPDISGLKSLQYLWVQNNKFTGPIPSEIGDLSSLQNLGMENNHLTGSIPASIVQLSSLPYMFLQNNELIGSLPDLSGLVNLQGLSLSNNSIKLSVIPSWVSSLKQSLALLFLDNCSLIGAFPSDLVFGLGSLTSAMFDNNKFNGSLNLSNIGKNMTLLSLENNMISELKGPVPTEVTIRLGGNPLCSNVSFELPDLCELSTGRGPTVYSLQSSCPDISCLFGQAIDPNFCQCSYPLISEFVLQDPPYSTITGSRVGKMQRQLAVAAKYQPNGVVITNASFSASNRLTVRVLFFPFERGFWTHSEIYSIKNELNQKNVLSKDDGSYQLVFVTPPKGNIHTNSVNLKAILAPTIPVTVAVILCSVAIFFWRRKEARKRTLMYGVQQEFAKNSLQPTFFQYQDLKIATHDFDPLNRLGVGGFGEVYKGELLNGTVVAVKRLFPSRIQQGTPEFVNEVKIITGVLHRNLVKLYGCCIEGSERLLVYEFVEHNSLSQALFGLKEENFLDWKHRFDIAVGTAKGIAYLHVDCETRIIHRDIKASNILLDKHLNPKIADFGLARLFPEGASHVSTKVAGTFGYVAPEYGLYGQLTEKADTFSYGVVLLELVSGRKSIQFDEETVLLLDCAWELYQHGRILELVDSRLKGDYNEEEFIRAVNVALLCTQVVAFRRPSMSHVVTMLLGEREIKETPSSPGTLSEIAHAHSPSHSASTS